jgi:hypothetical protein
MKKQFTIEWLDSGREPQCKPNPDFPDGKDMDVSFGADKTCTIKLPYPAQRCGVYVITCGKCGLRVGVTTAGRPDDPKSARIACKP